MIRKTLIGLLVISVALAFSTAAFAKKAKYEEGAVSGGGSISGTVSLKGNPPPPIMEDLNKGKNVEFCVTHPDTKEGGIRPRSKVIAKGGKLSGTVVFIEDITKGKAWDWKNQNFDFKTCDIFPKIGVVKKASKAEKKAGGVASITNLDPNILHNPHGYSVVGASRKTLFNKPLPSKGDVAEVSKNLARFKQKKDNYVKMFNDSSLVQKMDDHGMVHALLFLQTAPLCGVTGNQFAITKHTSGFR